METPVEGEQVVPVGQLDDVVAAPVSAPVDGKDGA
jgi:hypothetical protein